ncbi:MAG TPA: hypothetical protein VLD62_13220, partial [Acidimicrobiia bacterium]|nr:hypothetical protein [Acidimicrobiia bacterium]
DSTLEGLRRQFSAHVDGVKWNASRRVGDGLEFESVPLRGFKVASTAVVWWTAMSLSLAALSLVLWRRWPTRMRILVIGMTVGNLVGYTVLFFGDARFRYTLDAVLLVPVALTVKALWEARQSASAPSET